MSESDVNGNHGREQEFLNSAMAMAGVGRFVCRLDGVVLHSDPVVTRILGFDSAEELLGKRLNGLVKYVVDNASIRAQLVENRGIRGIEYPFITHHGIHKWVKLDAVVAQYEGDSEPVIHAIAQDITDRKRSEADLEEERERLSVTLHCIADGVISTDVKGNIVIINPVACDMTGHKREFALGKPFDVIFKGQHRSTGEDLSPRFRQLCREGLSPEIPPVIQLQSSDGTRRIVAVSGAEIKSAVGQRVGAVVVFRDITTRKKLEEEMARVSRLESLALLAGGLGHDFNNLLLAVMGNISLLRRKVDESALPVLDAMDGAAQRAGALTRQLMSFAKGNQPVRRSLELAPLLAESVTLASTGSNVRFAVDIGDDLGLVALDPAQIGQAVRNLVLNAVQAMPNGGQAWLRAHNVTFSGQRHEPLPPGNYVRIQVQDSGVGIPLENLERVFDPYFTTKPGGTGLGLAITHSVVQNHGGHISVDSSPGRGTTFTILLPVMTDSQAPTRAPSERGPVVEPGLKVLVMDDHPGVRATLQAMLQHLMANPAQCTNGEEAVSLYIEALKADEPFDIVLLDLVVAGGMGGIEALQWIRNFHPSVCAIAMSGDPSSEAIANPIEAGFAAAIGKPFSVGELAETLASALAVKNR